MAGFDASASALGFLHQVRWALCELLLAAKRTHDPTVRITIEVYDDVAVTDNSGSVLRAVQLKQHAGHGTVTDQSVDLWKTLRVWLQTESLASTEGPLLVLATTASIADGSAASFLTPDTHARDEQRAAEQLDAAASSGTSADTKAGRQAWLDASPTVRTALLARITILGDEVHIADVDDVLDTELAPTVPAHHLAEYRNRLWGWWDSRAVGMLVANTRNEPVLSVSATELHERMQLIRDQFTVGSLIEDVNFSPDEDEIAAGHGQDFVRQLRWVHVGDQTLNNAVIDYLRAYAHTTKWVQNGDLFDDELERYETALKDEWSRRFAEMLEDLESDGITDPHERAIRGRDLFRALGRSVDVRIRPQFDAPFHARGTRNGLANGGEYGWHPDFKQKLADLLQTAI